MISTCPVCEATMTSVCPCEDVRTGIHPAGEGISISVHPTVADKINDCQTHFCGTVERTLGEGPGGGGQF